VSIDRILAGQFVFPKAEAQPAVYRVFVRDLVVSCSIGVFDHERLAPQRVRINVDLTAREPGAVLDDDVAKVVRYDDVIEGIRMLIAEGHVNLVETLAERIAEFCLGNPRVLIVRVRVEKPDVVVEAAGVGVEIERRRTDADWEGVAAFPPLPDPS